jgi:DNA repair protein RadC
MKDGHVAVLLLATRDLSNLPCGIFDTMEGAEKVLKERGSLGEVVQVPINQLSLFPDVWETEANKKLIAEAAKAKQARFHETYFKDRPDDLKEYIKYYEENNRIPE